MYQGEINHFLCNDKDWIELLVAHKFSLSRAATLHYVKIFFSTNSQSNFTFLSMKFTLNFNNFIFYDTYTLQINKSHSKFHCFYRNFVQNLLRLTSNNLQRKIWSRTYSSHCAESEKSVKCKGYVENLGKTLMKILKSLKLLKFRKIMKNSIFYKKIISKYQIWSLTKILFSWKILINNLSLNVMITLEVKVECWIKLSTFILKTVMKSMI
jgi:hypothetical protein